MHDLFASKCEIHGEILQIVDLAALSCQPKGFVDLPGEFWVAIKNGGRTDLVASRNGTRQCFYHAANGQFHYGESVADVLKSSGTEWSWNWRAAASVSYFATRWAATRSTSISTGSDRPR